GGQGREPGDPIQEAAALRSAGYRLEIIAFDMDGKRSKTVAAWNQQIEAMAEAAGGRWVSVTDAADLAPAMVAAATGRPGHCTVSDSEGKVVYAGPFEGNIDLDPGRYRLRALHGAEPFEVEFTVTRGRTTRVEFDAAQM
ncbi:MAG: hypothetical protein AAGG01_18900, partial [Planctomycetota bacterium]